MSKAAMEIPHKTSSLAPLPHWNADVLKGHRVQFYEDDSFLLEEVSRFLGSAIGAGDFAIAITTEAHREGLSARLGERGIDLDLASSQQRLLWFNASELMKEFMDGAMPDSERFLKIVGGLIDQLTSAMLEQKRRIAIFGEMVALLGAEKNWEAAIRLEELWNQLAQTHSFQLYCAYPMRLFSESQNGSGIAQICAEHSTVVPSEQYTLAPTEEERLRAIVLLQQKAQSLEAEICDRQKIQHALEEREAELKDYLENAVIGMHWVAPDGTVLWANKAEISNLGYERDEYIGHHISEFHADKPVIDDILQRLSRSEELRGYEARLRCKDGSFRYVRIDSNVYEQGGKFVHTRCFSIDITEEKQAEQSLSRLGAIVESSDDAIISKDLNGMITSWNNSAERILGYTPQEIIGKSILLLIPPELHHDEPVILAKIRAGERIEHFQTVRLHKNGTRLDVSLTISPVKNRHGRIVGAAKILRDVTHQKKLEAALHTTEKLASVGRLAATFAHEINNPLEAVTNFIYLARQSPGVSDETQRYLESADHELRRAAHIAQQTLGFYRDTSQAVLLTLADVVNDVLLIYQRKFGYKRLHIKQQIEPTLKMEAWQGELKQVLSNLIANSLDATREGGTIVVRVRASQHFQTGRPEIRFTVSDNGVGASKEVQNKLFTPFFTTKKEVGTGLGLWITKDLLEKRGGRIRMRSRSSKPSGTTITFCLPTKQTATKANDLS